LTTSDGDAYDPGQSLPEANLLEPGSQVGPYEVVALLGTGGMGEVFVGYDPRLARRVALKTLPDSLSSSAERVARLHTEARALAALSHAHIAALFGLEEAADRRPVLVMELVDGPSLADRLVGGALPLAEALGVASQIARAIEAAHEKGVLHRDLKPANIRFAASGEVKLLDFGLAKLLGDAGGPLDSSARTDTAEGTGTSGVLGTGPYMSPEQARGEALDRRTDVWSFGCVLFEMIAGRRAFPGRTRADAIAAILERPPDWSALPAAAPSPLRQLLALCLEKDRDRRLRDVGDARLQIEALSQEVPGGMGTGVRRMRSRVASLVAGGLLLLAAGAALHLWIAPHVTPTPPVYRQIAYGRGTVTAARFSGDGQTIAYSAAWEGGPPAVYTHRLDAADAPPRKMVDGRLVAMAGGEMAVLSSDGTLARVPLAGGPPREIANGIAAADWGGDDDFVAVRWAEGSAQLEWPLGRVIYRAAGASGLFEPRLSREQDSVAFLEAKQLPFLASVVQIDRSGSALPLGSTGLLARGIAWSPDGREIWFNGGGHEWAGDVRAVAPGAGERIVARAPGSLRLFDTHPTGAMLAARESYHAEAWGQLAGDTAPHNLTWSQETWVPAIGRDGRSFLIQHMSSLDGTTYLAQVGKEPIRLGAGAATDLSPDGAWAVHVMSDSHVILVPCGAGEPRRVSTAGLREVHTVKFLPDGRGLLLQASEGQGRLRLFVQDSPDAVRRAVTPEGVAGIEMASGSVTPDGQWVVGRDYSTGESALYPLAGGSPRSIPGLLRNEKAVQWQQDGHHLFVQEERRRVGSGRSFSIVRLDTRTAARQPWLRFDLPDPAGVTFFAALRITPDGRYWTASYFRTLSDLYLVQGVR